MTGIVETRGRASAGLPYLLSGIALFVVVVGLFYLIESREFNGWWYLLPAVLTIVATVCVAGLYALQPNQTAVLSLFGDYRGSDRAPGLRFRQPALS